MIRTTLALLLITTIIVGVAVMAPKKAKAQPVAGDPENTLFLDLKDGRVVIALRPDLAPKHVARIKELTRQKFYDGVVFHRVIDGFMAQTGDPTGTGMGGSGQKIKAEFSKEPHMRGVVSMARAASIDSADSQFFIVLSQSSYLDGQYTVWGKVTAGMEFVDKIKKGDQNDNGKVSNPDKIITMRVAADVKDEAAAPAAAAQ
jgi:peptidylprolyl isomerase